MLKRIFRIYVLFLLMAFCVFACSEIGIQAKKEEITPAAIPDCEKNCTREGGLISRPIYKTWVKFDLLDVKNGFDVAVKTLQSKGH